MSAIFHWARLYLRPAVLTVALAMVFVNSAAIAEDAAKAAPSAASNAFVNDPIHQAGLKASANHKIVFVLGDGFGRRPLMSLKNLLSEEGLREGRHYEVMAGAASPKEAGVLYIGSELLKLDGTSQPFVFDQYAGASAASVVRQAIKAGTIIVEKPQ